MCRQAGAVRARDGRGGVRSGRDLRDATAAARAANRRRDHRRRLGRRHRRRHHRVRARTRAAARRPAGCDRREVAAPLEPQQPDRPRGRRDPRHDPRGARAGRRPRRRRRDRLPRARHPVEPGRLMRDGPLLPGPRARTHRRVPRTPGRALRPRRRRHLRRDRQADPHRDRAGRRVTRQPRPGDGPCHRAGLLRVGEPCRRSRSSCSGGTRGTSNVAPTVDHPQPSTGARPHDRTRARLRACRRDGVARRRCRVHRRQLPRRRLDRHAASQPGTDHDRGRAAAVAAPAAVAVHRHRRRTTATGQRRLRARQRGTRASRSTGRGRALARHAADHAARAGVDAEAPHRCGRARAARPRSPVHDPGRHRRARRGRNGARRPLRRRRRRPDARNARVRRLDARRPAHRERTAHAARRRSPTRSSPRACSASTARSSETTSRHESLRFLPSWKPNYRTDGEVGALSALAVDHGFAAPGSAAVPDDPPAATARRLAELLAARGVTVAGAGTVGRRASRSAPGRAGRRRRRSPISSPRPSRASDNYAAETLAR